MFVLIYLFIAVAFFLLIFKMTPLLQTMHMEGCFLPMTFLVLFHFWFIKKNVRNKIAHVFKLHFKLNKTFCSLQFVEKIKCRQKVVQKEHFSTLFSFAIFYFWHFNNCPTFGIVVNYLHAFQLSQLFLVDCCVWFHFFLLPSSYS